MDRRRSSIRTRRISVASVLLPLYPHFDQTLTVLAPSIHQDTVAMTSPHRRYSIKSQLIESLLCFLDSQFTPCHRPGFFAERR